MAVYHLKKSTHAEQYRWMKSRIQFNQDLSEHQDKQAEKRIAARILDVCQEIRYLMTQEEYDTWWASTPDIGFFKVACDKMLDLKVYSLLDPCVSYNNRHVPGKYCPVCNTQLVVNEKKFKTDNPNRPHYERRLVCPMFQSRGCNYTETFTPEIQVMLDHVKRLMENAPPDF
jgi:hypothetical protein